MTLKELDKKIIAEQNDTIKLLKEVNANKDIIINELKEQLDILTKNKGDKQ